MDILKIATAGSVDDGKSTLIGRLLYETNTLKEDQIAHIKAKSEAKGYDYLDLSLATDGLLTEREQGITIDVSNIYFTTDKRRFIIADAPGHIEYTRNMITGASTAAATIILIDARKGIVEQTKRHFYLTQLLGIQQIIFAINKMDLVNFSQEVYNKILHDISSITHKWGAKDCQYHYIPIAALGGENIVASSEKMSWYLERPLLPLLENINTQTIQHEESIIQVQYVIRPKQEAFHDYRGFAGKVNSGRFKVGDPVQIHPSGVETSISEIEKYGINVPFLSQGENGTIILKDPVDLSRGNSINGKNKEIPFTNSIKATVCWMENESLNSSKKYWLQQGCNKVQARVANVENKVNIDQLALESATQLGLNDIGTISIQTAETIIGISYQENQQMGAFILINPVTNNTAGLGFIK